MSVAYRLEDRQKQWIKDMHGSRTPASSNGCTVQVRRIETGPEVGYLALNPDGKCFAKLATGRQDGLLTEDHLVEIRMLRYLLEIRIDSYVCP